VVSSRASRGDEYYRSPSRSQLKIRKSTQAQGFRVLSDLRNEKIGFKIRERTLERIPYLLVVGDREVEQNTVSVRTRDGKDLGSMSLDRICR
jgi:threonyl-tRNA synthetase